MAYRDEDIHFSKTKKGRDSEGSLERMGVPKLRQMVRERDVVIEEMQDSLLDMESRSRRLERKLRKELEKQKEEIEELTVENKGERQDLNKFRFKIKDLEKTIRKLEDQLEMKDEEIRAKEERWAEEARTKSSFDHKLEEETKNIERLEGERKRLMEVVESLESENEELKMKREDTKSDKQKVIDKLKSKIDEYRETNDSLRNDISRLRSAIDDSKKRESECEGKNEQLHSLLKNQQFTIDDLSTKIRELEKVRVVSSKTSVAHSSPTATITSRETLVQESFVGVVESKSPDCNENMAVCPNCGGMVGSDVIEAHLERCLEEL